MANADVAWVDVLPSMRDFLPSLTKELGRAIPRAGQRAGADFGAGFTRGSVDQVEQASTKMQAALRKVENAAGQVRVAEAKLNDLRAKGRASAAQLVAAEENLAKAKRTLDTQNEAAERSTRDLTRAQERASQEAKGLDRNLDALGRRSNALRAPFSMLRGVLAGLSFAAIGRGIYSVGSTFDEVSDTIRAGTGKTGVALDGLVASAKNVGKNVPAQFENIGVTITDLNKRLGLTGPTLEKLTSQVLEAGRITGEAINVESLARSFAAFNVTGDETTRVTDRLFQISQATGVSMNQLTGSLVKGAPILQQFGFNVDQSAVLLGTMRKAGLDSDATLTALRRGLVEFAKAGKDPQEALRGTITEIQRFVEQGNIAGAVNLAGKIFGTRGASQFVAAVQSGAVNVEALTSAAGQTGDTILGAAEETKDFAERWQEFKNRVLVWLEPVASRVFGGLASAMQWVTKASEVFGAAWRRNDQTITQSGALGVVERFGGVARVIFDQLRQSVTAFANAWRYNDGEITSSGLPGFFELLGFWARRTFDFIRGYVIPPLRSLVGFFAQNTTALGVLVVGLGALWATVKIGNFLLGVQAVGGLVNYIKQIKIVAGVTKAWAAIQAVFNAVMNANPIVRIITILTAIGVALVAAYQHSATFRKIVDGAFRAVAEAGRWMWENVLRPTWVALTAGWTAISTGVAWAWSNVIRPAWNALSTAARWMWDNVLQPVFSGIAAAWNGLTTGIRWYWEHILRPVWNIIAAAATVLFRILTVAVFLPIRLAWDVLTAGIRWAWEHVLRPVWTAIQAAAQFLWANVLRPIWTAMRAAWDALLAAFRWAWEHVLHPVWTAVQAAAQFLWTRILSPIFGAIGRAWDLLMRGMRVVYDRVIHPMWEIIKSAIGAVRRAFEAVVAGISRVWNTLMDILATPINFVIEVIFNRGLFSAWNWAIDKLGLPKSWRAPHWNQLPRGKHFADGGQAPDGEPDRYAGGGPIRGPWRGPKADNVLGWVPGSGPIRVNPKEFIEPVASVDYYGVPFMEAIRRRAIPREALSLLFAGGQVPGLAAGGQTWQAMWNVVHGAIPYARLTSAYRPGDPGYHGAGQAIDVAGSVPYPGGNSVAQMTAINQWMARRWGAAITELIHTGPGAVNLWHGAPHTYDAFTRAQHANHVHLAIDSLAKVIAGSTVSASATVDQPWYQDLWGSVTGAFNWFKSKIGAVGEMVSRFGNNPFVNIVKSVPGALLDKMWGAIRDKVGGLFLAGQDITPGNTAGLTSAVQTIAQNWGWQSGAQWDALSRLIQGESSWNPRAENPTSTASGLFQFIDSTWNNYKGIGVPATHASQARVIDQAAAGMRYIKSVYGDPLTAYRMWSARAPHWYHEGGQVPVLDDGGLWPPGPGFNLTGDFERVLTPTQDVYGRRLVEAVEVMEGHGGGGDRSLIDHVTLAPRDLEEGARMLNDLWHMLRVADRGGVFASVGDDL